MSRTDGKESLGMKKRGVSEKLLGFRLSASFSFMSLAVRLMEEIRRSPVGKTPVNLGILFPHQSAGVGFKPTLCTPSERPFYPNSAFEFSGGFIHVASCNPLKVLHL